MYPLNVHDLKCKVSALTPDQIIICLTDTENHIFKDHRTCLLLEMIYFVSVRSLNDNEIRSKLLLSSIFFY